MLEPLMRSPSRVMRRWLAVRGVTLTETMVVMAIVALIVTLAAPSFNDTITRERVRGVNAELVSDLAYARSEAVQRVAPVAVDFRGNDTTSCYAIYVISSGRCDCLQAGTPCQNEFALVLKTVVVPRTHGVLIDLQNAQTTITAPRGKLVNGGALTVPVKSVGSRSLELETTIGDAGQVQTCLREGSMNGVPSCNP